MTVGCAAMAVIVSVAVSVDVEKERTQSFAAAVLHSPIATSLQQRPDKRSQSPRVFS